MSETLVNPSVVLPEQVTLTEDTLKDVSFKEDSAKITNPVGLESLSRNKENRLSSNKPPIINEYFNCSL
jgi:hypothetical protein